MSAVEQSIEKADAQLAQIASAAKVPLVLVARSPCAHVFPVRAYEPPGSRCPTPHCRGSSQGDWDSLPRGVSKSFSRTFSRGRAIGAPPPSHFLFPALQLDHVRHPTGGPRAPSSSRMLPPINASTESAGQGNGKTQWK